MHVHGRDFRPVWVERKNSRINGPTYCSSVIISDKSDLRTPIRFDSQSQARCLVELYINSISQFHSLPNYDSTSQYYVLFNSIMPNHHPVLLSPSWQSLLNSLPILLLLPPLVLMSYCWNSRLINHQVNNQASEECVVMRA
jgi:hypothetical protein